MEGMPCFEWIRCRIPGMGIQQDGMGKMACCQDRQRTPGEAGERPPHARKPVPNAEGWCGLGLTRAATCISLRPAPLRSGLLIITRRRVWGRGSVELPRIQHGGWPSTLPGRGL